MRMPADTNGGSVVAGSGLTIAETIGTGLVRYQKLTVPVRPPGSIARGSAPPSPAAQST